jgi:hypothetical protein
MARYAVAGNAGAASITAATAGIIQLGNPASATMAAAKCYEWSLGPQANSADETYGVRMKRGTSVGTYTSTTPFANDPKASASVTTGWVAGTAASTPVSGEQGRWGFHQRGGYRWVAIPGGEFQVSLTFSASLFLEYVFAQGTSVNGAAMYFEE